MIIPARVQLPARFAGSKLGYRVQHVDLSPFADFTTKNVSEIQPAVWVAIGGVEAPEAGGYIVWGLKGRDITGATLPPSTVQPVLTGTKQQLGESLRHFVDAVPKPAPLPPPAPVIVKTDTFEAGVNDLRIELLGALRSSVQDHVVHIADVAQRVTDLQTDLRSVDVVGEINQRFASIETTVHQLAQLGVTAQRLDEMTSLVMRMLTMNANQDWLGAIVAKLELLYTEMRRTNDAANHVELVRQQTLSMLDNFLEEQNADDE